jgi:hypothetical protein
MACNEGYSNAVRAASHKLGDLRHVSTQDNGRLATGREEMFNAQCSMINQ